MRAIAEYAMRGRTQAVTVAAISAAIPLMFWISAATIALATLRKGWVEGLNLLLWASLPAAVWVVMQRDPTPLVVIVGSAALAAVLRATVSWVFTLLAGCVLGLVVSWMMPLLLPELVAETVRVGQQVLEKMATELATSTGQQIEGWLESLFTGVLGMIHLLAIIASLVIARWWQSALYNPGGFKTEFHQILLPRVVSIPMMLVVAFGSGLHPVILGLMPILSVPFLIAGIALVHGVVGIRGLSSQWLVAFYLLIFFAGPYLYMMLLMLAFVDSIFDIRQRMQRSV